MNKVDEKDQTALDGLRELENEGGPPLVAALAGLFFRDAVARLGSLRRAIGSADAVGIEKGAQSLKGSSASVGATAMSLMCGELEEEGRVGDIQGASKTLSRIEEEFERVRAILEADISRAGRT
jgi:HPt (histidine-containing phosphotransfer) domain-containing protein